MNEDCIFCRIAQGSLPARFIYQDEQIIAFQDISPKTPVHLLVVPRKHFESLNAINDNDAGLLGHLLVVASRLAADTGIAESGYRLVINTGPDAGQTVSHLHLHLIGGKPMPVFFPAA